MSCLPSTAQEALLEVLFQADVDHARHLARRWLASTDLEPLDPSSARMLYTMHLRLRELGLEAESPDKIRGAYKLSWSRLAILRHEGVSALRLLTESGIPIVLLKSTALEALYSNETLLRATSDVDFYVPPAHTQRAAGLLRAAGWNAYWPVSWPEEMRFKHGLSLSKPGFILLDLHWCPIYRHLMPPRLPDDYPLRSVPSMINDLPIAATEPTDLLFHILAHGATPMRSTTFHWIVDAMILIRRADGAIDYGRLGELANRYNARERVRRTLGHLKTRWGAAIPDDLLADGTSPNRTSGPVTSVHPTGLAYLCSVFIDAWRTTGKYSDGRAGLIRRVVDIRLYFRWVWGLRPGQSLLVTAAIKVLRRLTRRR